MKTGWIFLSAVFALLLCSCSENGNVEQVSVAEDTDYFVVRKEIVSDVSVNEEAAEDKSVGMFTLLDDTAAVEAEISCDFTGIFLQDVSILCFSGDNLFFLKLSESDETELCFYNTADRAVRTAGTVKWNYMSNYASKVMGERYLVFSAENSAGADVYVYDILQDDFYTADTLPNSSINVYTAQINEHEFAYYYSEAYNSGTHEGHIKIFDLYTRESREIYSFPDGDEVNFMTFDGSELYLFFQKTYFDVVSTNIQKVDLLGNVTEKRAFSLEESRIGVIRYMKYAGEYLYIGGYDVFGDTRGVFFDPENDFAPASSYDMKLSTPLIMNGGDIQLFKTVRNNGLIAAADTERRIIYYLAPDIEGYDDYMSVHAVCNERGDIALYMIPEEDGNIRLAFISSENVKQAINLFDLQ
ncbi:MAG: hypothetical protein NC120_13785 [Ruminococcus sp.]|nr:hypothetical protein [Ruminococcus sp.]